MEGEGRKKQQQYQPTNLFLRTQLEETHKEEPLFHAQACTSTRTVELRYTVIHIIVFL